MDNEGDRSKERARGKSAFLCVTLLVWEDDTCSPNHVTAGRKWPRHAGGELSELTDRMKREVEEKDVDNERN